MCRWISLSPSWLRIRCDISKKTINLGKDLGIEKIGPFKPLAYSQEDLERAVEAIIAKIQKMEGETE